MNIHKKPKVFINYRRSDTISEAGRLYNDINNSFGDGFTFIDLDDIKLGEKWKTTLQNTINDVSIMLIVIGENWLELSDKTNLPRIHDEEDMVRFEIREGINQKKIMIPIRLNNVSTPPEIELPTDINSLPSFQNYSIDNTSWNRDVKHLNIELSKLLGIKKINKSRLNKLIKILLSIGFLSVFILMAPGPFTEMLFEQKEKRTQSTQEKRTLSTQNSKEVSEVIKNNYPDKKHESNNLPSSKTYSLPPVPKPSTTVPIINKNEKSVYRSKIKYKVLYFLPKSQFGDLSNMNISSFNEIMNIKYKENQHHKIFLDKAMKKLGYKNGLSPFITNNIIETTLPYHSKGNIINGKTQGNNFVILNLNKKDLTCFKIKGKNNKVIYVLKKGGNFFIKIE